MLLHEALTREIIGAAIEVHRILGPGLLESAYKICLAREFCPRGLSFQTEVDLPIDYEGVRLDCGYRTGFVIEEAVVLENKSVEKLAPVSEAQLITYLKLSRLRVGLLLNFNVPILTDGIVRRVL